LPNLLAAIAGNLWELNPFSGMRLLDLTLPPEFLARYRGPQFGVAGTRRLTGVHGRPLIGTITKPSIGLSPQATAERVAAIAAAGIDFVKDDELQADGPLCPFEARLSAVMRVLNEHADRTGKRVMYAVNITGEIDEMLRRHDRVLAERNTCIMVSLNSIGLPALAALRAHCQVAIPGDRHELHRLAEALARGRHRPRTRQRPRQQVLREQRIGDRLGPRVPDTDVSRAACRMRDRAGLLVGPVGPAGAGHLSRAWLDRPHPRLRRRHHGSSRRRRRRCQEFASGLGGRGIRHPPGRI